MIEGNMCPFISKKESTAKIISEEVIKLIEREKIKKINAMWIEVTGCSGNIISFLNGENPGLIYILKNLVNLTYNNSIMSQEGQGAFLPIFRYTKYGIYIVGRWSSIYQRQWTI